MEDVAAVWDGLLELQFFETPKGSRTHLLPAYTQLVRARLDEVDEWGDAYLDTLDGPVLCRTRGIFRSSSGAMAWCGPCIDELHVVLEDLRIWEISLQNLRPGTATGA